MIIVPISQMGKLRLREAVNCAQGCTTRKWQGWGSHPGLYDPQESVTCKSSWIQLVQKEPSPCPPPSFASPCQGVRLSIHFPCPPDPLLFPLKPPQKALSLFICHFRRHRQAGISERNFISFWLSLSFVAKEIEITKI